LQKHPDGIETALKPFTYEPIKGDAHALYTALTRENSHPPHPSALAHLFLNSAISLAFLTERPHIPETILLQTAGS